MKKPFKHFGEAIRKIRIQHEVTQKQVGEAVGVHPQFVSNAERGICGLPASALKRLVKKYKVPREFIRDAMTEDARAQIEDYCGLIYKGMR